ncbi:unnamed protein product [Ilex paraguariensis]|uniref:Uncharacterized protein n=1 Tax=Ilex paraguariensis TaxID=185542 RepID=A0ABC8SP26_9AQUA
MAGSDENYPRDQMRTRSGFLQGGLRAGNVMFTPGIGQNWRALNTINRNIVGAAPYPCAINNRSGLPE